MNGSGIESDIFRLFMYWTSCESKLVISQIYEWVEIKDVIYRVSHSFEYSIIYSKRGNFLDISEETFFS